MSKEVEELVSYCMTLGCGGWAEGESQHIFMRRAMRKARELGLLDESSSEASLYEDYIRHCTDVGRIPERAIKKIEYFNSDGVWVGVWNDTIYLIGVDSTLGGRRVPYMIERRKDCYALAYKWASHIRKQEDIGDFSYMVTCDISPEDLLKKRYVLKFSAYKKEQGL